MEVTQTQTQTQNSLRLRNFHHLHLWYECRCTCVCVSARVWFSGVKTRLMLRYVISDVNLTTTFGDLSPFVAIVNIGEVADLFVARYFHNYSTVGDYLVNISAYNNINRKTIRGIATVERKLQDLKAQVCLWLVDCPGFCSPMNCLVVRCFDNQCGSNLQSHCLVGETVLKMISTQVVETAVTRNNSPSHDSAARMHTLIHLHFYLV